MSCLRSRWQGHPEAIALVYEEQSLSYEELNRQANQLAHYLIGLGVKPDERVAICVERGVEMVVGLLAILKAGGAYVPLDPAYPEERLAYILEDTQAAFVLTQAKLEEKLTGLLPVATRLITLDRQWDEISERAAGLMRCRTSELSQDVNPHHLAYVIYTFRLNGPIQGSYGGASVRGELVLRLEKQYLQWRQAGRIPRVCQRAFNLRHLGKAGYPIAGGPRA